MSELTHFDDEGAARMVDVGGKQPSDRYACASGRIRMQAETLQRITAGDTSKGDVLQVARLAGIMATKQTANLIPLCHPLGLDSASVDFDVTDEQTITIRSEVSLHGRTGVEMEALTAVSVAALTIYDMCKSIDRDMVIEQVQLEEKRGGRSGHYRRS